MDAFRFAGCARSADAVYVGPAVMEELKRIITDSEIMKWAGFLGSAGFSFSWPRRQGGRQILADAGSGWSTGTGNRRQQ